jgi:hypothetical protein
MFIFEMTKAFCLSFFLSFFFFCFFVFCFFVLVGSSLFSVSVSPLPFSRVLDSYPFSSVLATCPFHASLLRVLFFVCKCAVADKSTGSQVMGLSVFSCATVEKYSTIRCLTTRGRLVPSLRTRPNHP